MRAKNREINIFNMSLLDILTGMLGAFLFLMLGLLPYYAKVSKNKDINPEEFRQLKQENQNLKDQVELQKKQIADLQKQLDDLQKIIQQSAGGSMTADQIQQLMNQMTQLRQQLQAAQDQAQQLQGQLTQAQQQLDQTSKEKSFWKAQQGTVAILSSWDSSNTDIDVMAMAPDGSVYGPKVKDKFQGKDCIFDGDDSHAGTTKYNHEGLVLYLSKSGDYLVFYHVPQNAIPADYISLHAYALYSEVIGQDQGGAIMEDTLGNSKAALARPGGYYAWATITYDADKHYIRIKPVSGTLPKGIEYPQFPPPPPPAPGFPFPSPSPSILSHAPHL